MGADSTYGMEQLGLLWTYCRRKEVKANTDYMAEKLKEYGWQYIVVDIRWYVEMIRPEDTTKKILVMYLMNTGATNQPSTVFHRLLMEQDLRHWQTIYITKV